jgi:GNAT superfamily N-acetyltransferase
MRASRELAMLMPGSPPADWPPERACRIMAGELEALSADIDAARARARRIPAGLQFGRQSRPRPQRDLERVTVGDGRTLIIRPIEHADARELLRLFHRLSALSRFRRFLTPLDQLSPRQVQYLTEVDHIAHEALIAFDAETEEGVGVARYLCEPRDPRRGRFAIVVVDAWQGCGVGTALLTRLGARASANGVESLTGRTVASNHAARRVRSTTTLDPRTGTLELTVRPSPADSRPASPAEPDRRRASVPYAAPVRVTPEPAASQATL